MQTRSPLPRARNLSETCVRVYTFTILTPIFAFRTELQGGPVYETEA